MTDDPQRARELLAMCFDEWSFPTEASNVRDGEDLESYECDLRLLQQLRVFGLLRYPTEADAIRASPEVLHIEVRNHHESGSFYLREGVEGEGDRKHYWCELTCNTSFGIVGHYWSSMGSPAARFLSKLNRGYLIGKLWGSEASVFCGDTAVAEAKAALLRERRDGDLSKEDAREAFDVFWSVSTEFEWHQMVLDCEWLHRHLMDCGGPFGSVTNPQALGFWEELWPAFITELTAARPQGVKDV